MPELPEVECFARSLREGRNLDPDMGGHPGIRGARIISFWTDRPKNILPSAATLRRAAIGSVISAVGRRGKFIVIGLGEPDGDHAAGPGPGSCLLIHLRMSGRLYVLPRASTRGRHVHALFALDNGYAIHFDDARTFGRLRIIRDISELEAELGPEPLEEAFTPAVFAAILRSSRARIKALLLDQSAIAGIGNIYADESLWKARIHPLRPANSLTSQEAWGLRTAIRASLRAGIRAGGSAIDWVYPGGGYQESFKAYGRGGLPCSRCGTPMKRILVSQRSSCYCPLCQRPGKALSRRRR
jgi:formamidopyrimidine-DNA glycosylase